jgi:hypothetical protein
MGVFADPGQQHPLQRTRHEKLPFKVTFTRSHNWIPQSDVISAFHGCLFAEIHHIA